MAIITDDDKLQKDPNDIAAQQSDTGGIAAGGDITGGQSAQDVGGGVSTAGVGAGGTGGWTNIQAYLDANKQDTGSAQALDKTVSDQFKNEKDAYTQDSANALAGAKQKVDADKIDNAQADQLISHAGTNYSYDKSKPASLDYGNDVQRVRGALTNTYSGPREYNYTLGNQTAEYGADLNDNQGFDSLMKHIYQGRVPGGLNSGQTELQKQLDVNNVGLVDKRKDLQNQYSDLVAGRDKTVADTTKGLGDLEQQYRTNQNQLQDYLTNRGSQLDTNIAQQEADARAAYNNTFQTQGSGQDNIFRPYFNRNASDSQALIQGGMISPLSAHGDWGDRGQNLTWQQLQREQDNINNLRNTDDFWYGNGGAGSGDSMMTHPFINEQLRPDWGGRMPVDRAGENLGVLNHFYADQDAKYANTADEQERQFNAIQDFLNSAAARKEQGFKVRG